MRYLGLPGDVISLLVCYCKERARKRGSLRNPSLRTIEKEAYQWAEQGIDTLEAASAYIQTQNQRESQMTSLMSLLQIRGRNLTAAEERYAGAWLTMGFDADAIREAYERTCLNTGGLNWAYMNKFSPAGSRPGSIPWSRSRAGDQKNLPKGASGQLGEAELEAHSEHFAGGINMAYSLEVVRRARERLEQQRADRESEYRAHLAEAYREQPRLREIDRLLRQTMAQAAQCAFLKGEEGTALMAKAKEANLALQAERRGAGQHVPGGVSQ